jgi:hypothetical protein
MANTTLGSEKKAKMLVAAIDFGTTYSGYAFSLKHEYQADPGKVSVNQNWVAGSMALVSLKAPTAVLFNEKKEFESFGYEAENMFSEYALDGEDRNHYFFNRFKMKLHEKKVNSFPRILTHRLMVYCLSLKSVFSWYLDFASLKYLLFREYRIFFISQEIFSELFTSLFEKQCFCKTDLS